MSIVVGKSLKIIDFIKTRAVFKKKYAVFSSVQDVSTCFHQKTYGNMCISFVFYLFSIQSALFLPVYTCYNNDNGGFFSLIAAGKSSPFVCALCTFDFSRKSHAPSYIFSEPLHKLPLFYFSKKFCYNIYVR